MQNVKIGDDHVDSTAMLKMKEEMGKRRKGERGLHHS